MDPKYLDFVADLNAALVSLAAALEQKIEARDSKIEYQIASLKAQIAALKRSQRQKRIRPTYLGPGPGKPVPPFSVPR